MSYRHPGKLFLAHHGLVQQAEAVTEYVEFLRESANLSAQPPIDLTQIYRHFDIPTPIRAPLHEQQGILLDSNQGIILIKEDDPIARQRFTEAHELVELLFDAQEQAQAETELPRWDEDYKERLCDQGAADLLMPQSSFVPRLEQMGMSFETGQSLSKLYQTSLIATLVRMIQQSTGDYALVVWHEAFKPIELKQPPQKPRKRKLRVWWQTHTQNWTGGFIPKAKSIPQQSLIARSFRTGHSQKGTEVIYWGITATSYQLAAIPLQMGKDRCVLSLLQPISLSP